MLESFFIRGGDPTLLLVGSYDPWLVGLSLLAAIATSWMAMQVAGLGRLADGGLRHAAVLSGALALGGGIWAMHFIGLLAFDICAPVSYSPLITVISLVPSCFASWVTLRMLVRPQITTVQLMVGGVLVGAGIGAMHYTGMASMQMAPALRYDPLWFAASIVVAVVLATLALWIRFGLIRDGRTQTAKATLLAGVVMGLAISGMHYMGMASARFIGTPDLKHVPGINDILALSIGLVTIVLAGLVLGGNAFLRHRQLFAQLQDRELRLGAILNTAVDGVITINADGQVLSLNHSAERLFGWKEQEMAGRPVSTLLPDAGQVLAGASGDNAGALTGTVREMVGLHRYGAALPVRFSVGKIDVPGQPLYVGLVTDISEREALEKELLSRELQYRTLIANLPGVTFRGGLEEPWPALFISDAVERLTGWPKEDFIEGRLHMADLIHPDDVDRLRREFREAIVSKRPYVLEYRIVRRDGRERWVSESARGIYGDDGVAQWVDGVILDITDAKLRAAEFEGTVNAINRAMAVAEFDLDGRVMHANPNYLNMVGYTLEELVGEHDSLLRLPEERDTDEYRALWDTLRSGAFASGEFCNVAKDGRPVWTQATYNPIYGADDKPLKIITLAIDLSERKAMEMDLMDAKVRAEAAAATKSTFLATMSHEIRTPMNAIIGFTDLLLATRLTDGQRRHLSTVRQSARSLLTLLNDILDTAKLERGTVEIEHADFSLRELCQQIIASLSIAAEKKGTTLRLVYPEAVGDYYKGDALRVRQVLINLIGNAVKFTQRGGVTVSISENEGTVQIAVQDTGIGIAEDRLQHIFAPFIQADSSMTRRFGGTGLGTTIARQLVELMGGTITVESTLNVGSTFTVTLPMARGVAVAIDARQHRITRPLKILAADDVPQNLELLELALGRDGHAVSTVSNGREAYKRLSNEYFDVALMDVHMPEMDGLEATRRIRAYEAQTNRTRTPIIALTASVLQKDRDEALAAGTDGFAAKPLELPDLIHEIARVLGEVTEEVEPSAMILPSPSPAEMAIAWEGALALWGTREALSQAIQRFLEDQKDAPERLRRAIAVHDPETAREIAHRLRGTAGNLSLRGLFQHAARLEDCLRETADPPSCLGMIDDVEAAMKAVSSAVVAGPADEEAPVSAAPVASKDPGQVLRWLDEVGAALARGALADDALNQLGMTLPTAEATRIRHLIDDFDFDGALAAIKEVRQNFETAGLEYPR